ncbi:MAG: hypothetical protein AAGA77_11330 [Bacteroidota bacterium]
MEGKYTKIGTVVGVIALLITIWQISRSQVASFEGEWIMTSQIEEAMKSDYIGMEIQWVLYLTQNGNAIEGTGEKIKVNGEDLDYTSRTKLELKGSIKGNTLNLFYKDFGTRRTTDGFFKGEVSGNTFSGTFTQRASDSKGIIFGEKKEQKE